jgi:hypothetical protein
VAFSINISIRFMAQRGRCAATLATMETDLSLDSAPAVADAASATIRRRPSELVRVITAFVRWLRFQPSDGSAQGAIQIFRFKAGHER